LIIEDAFPVVDFELAGAVFGGRPKNRNDGVSLRSCLAKDRA